MDLRYNLVNYKYSKLPGKELRAYMQIIQVFENLVNKALHGNLTSHKDREIK